jgi:hypothetical protein
VENPQDLIMLYESLFKTDDIKFVLGTSAKSGLNVENLFNQLCNVLYEVNKK